jgi:hypothetical protein
MDIEWLHPGRGRCLRWPWSGGSARLRGAIVGEAIISANLPVKIVRLIDQSLLILMIVEILYTLQVPFREHTLVAEPFLIVGLIAAIRRVLILTAEFSKPAEISEAAFQQRDVRAGSFDGSNPCLGLFSFSDEAATHRRRRSHMRGGLIEHWQRSFLP